ncbi:MAG: ATP phosphoribosyltransferase [archaeon]|nr:ATP phosphoribosyltransferase [archaeon]
MTVKMAIPNKGRLNERAIEILTKAGINLGSSWGRSLNIKVPDLDLEVIFVRAQDIPVFIDSGAVDFGITGQDVAAEAGSDLVLLHNLGFGHCRFSVIVPEDSAMKSVADLKDGIRIATTFPNVTSKFFEEQGIKAQIVNVQGAAEIMPYLGVADIITDLVETGGTLRTNHLKEIATVMVSDACLFSSEKALADEGKKQQIEEITDAIRSVLDADEKKYVMADVPKDKLDDVNRILPGIGGATVLNIAGNDSIVAVHAVVSSKDTYQVVRDLKKIGATGILTMPIERMVE